MKNRSGWALVVGWAVLALLVDLLWVDLYGGLFVLAPLLPLALWIGFAWLFILISVRGIREGSRASALVLLAALLMAGAVHHRAGDRIGILARFHASKHRYRAIVAAIQRGEPAPAGTRFEVDRGRPLRVVFPWPGGLLDNWQGVVYDPSGLVLRARSSRPDGAWREDPALFEVRRLFGGELYRCDPLGGDWYLCWFT